MRLVLYGPSAYRFWIHAVRMPRPGPLSDERVLANATPTTRTLGYLRQALPFLAAPIHLLTDRDSRHLGADIIVHRSSRTYPDGSFLQVSSGIYVPCPALTAAQVAGSVSDPLLARVLCLLLGTGALAPDERYGHRRRDAPANRESLASYLVACPGVPGGNRVRRLLPHLIEGVASPAEADLALALCLPYHLGGYHLKHPIANHPIVLSPRGRAIAGQPVAVVDLCWPEHGLVVEYDSDLTHLNPEQHARDASRRAALEHDGCRVMTITREHLYGPRSLDPVAQAVARLDGTRLRPRSPRWPERHAALRRLPRGYDLADGGHAEAWG